MKKIFLLLIAAILITISSQAQTAWIDYKIDNKLSVKLPVAPKVQDDGSAIAMDKDSLIYIITIVDFQKVAGIDSAALAPLLPEQEFADGIKTGILGKLPGFTMGAVKIGKLKDHYSYLMDGGNSVTKLKIYTYMIIIGDEAYSLTTLVPEKSGLKGKDDFFASVKLN
jgi:hypothetical protein